MLAALARGAPRWLFVGGKGGVGKTTIASALAIAAADAGDRTLALSTDPAHSLGDALGRELGAEPSEVPGAPLLWAMELDGERERDRWLAGSRAALASLLDRGTYLARSEIDELLSIALPGVDEVAAMLRLLELARAGDDPQRLVVDTAPTGHTLRLLDAPALAQGWLDALDTLERRGSVVEQAFRGPARSDEGRRFLHALREDVDGVSRRLRDPERCAMLLVTTSEPVVLAETHRYAAALRELGIALYAVVVNRAGTVPAELTRAWPDVPVLALPQLDVEPRGVPALRALGLASRGATAPVESRIDHHAGRRPQPHAAGATIVAVQPPRRWTPPLDRRLYVVGGKGGVGKSTVASAIALTLADAREDRVLLLSLDPAGSLGEVWAAKLDADAVPAPGARGLHLQQLQATGAWRAFRDEYDATARRLIDEIAGGAAASDQLATLAPPGLDELMAVVELVDLTAASPYVAVVLDTAPTGHLLRLLAMPDVALRWTHATMRLLLRYRDVAGLGELAERLLHFARGLRELDTLLRDERRRFVTVVALPEALSVTETERLLARLRARGLAAGALLVNRVLQDGSVPPERAGWAAALAQLPGAHVLVGAPALEHGPRGPSALAAFARDWRELVAAQRTIEGLQVEGGT